MKIGKWIIALLLAISLITCKEKISTVIDEIDTEIDTTMATYYIDPSGSNGNSGSVGSPWATLSYACSHTTSGDIIHVNSGTYYITTQVTVPVGVSIEGVGDASLFICSVTNSSLWGNAGYAILLSSYPIVSGAQHITNIKMSGNSFAGYGAIGVWYRHNVEISNCHFINFSHWGVKFYGGEPPSDAAHYMTGAVFHDNIVTDCAGFWSTSYQGVYDGSSSSLGGLGIGGVDGMYIFGNTITQPGTRGYNNEGVPIYGVGGFIKNTLIYGNTLTKTLITTGAWDFAIEIWNWEGGNQIYANDIIGSIDIVGATTKGTSDYSVWVHDNVIRQPALSTKQSVRGILFEGLNTDVIIERNYIHHVCQGIYFQTSSWGALTTLPQTNITIRYNVLDNIGSLAASSGWGIYFSQEDGDDPVTNFKCYNNTIIASTANSYPRWGISIPDCSVSSSGIYIQNNIVQGFNYAPIRMNDWSSGATTVTTLVIQDNIFYGNGNSNASSFASGTTQNSYTNSGNLTTAPPFISSSDYHLTSDRVGVYIASGLTDKDQVNVANPPSVGAYEFIDGTILVSSITVSGTGGATTISTDDGTLQMIADTLPIDATNDSVTWSRVNGTGTANISGTGLLTALTNGNVTVRATAQDGSGVYDDQIITLSNQAVLVSGIIVSGTGYVTTITVPDGTLQMVATVLPGDATDSSVTWSRTNGSGTATISGTGLVTALTDGTVTVRATANDASGQYDDLTITISNQTVAEILVDTITVTGTGGATTISVDNGTLQMLASVLPVDSTNKTYTWSIVSGSGVGEITPTGLLSAAVNGTVTVQAIANDSLGTIGSLVITISNQTLPPSKHRYAYRAYTATDIKTRASIPDADDMEIYASYVGCNRITTTKINAILGTSLHKIKDFEIDGAINHWSAFGPTVRTISGGSPKMLVNSNPTRYREADFAAYNHVATAPDFITDPHDTMISIIPGETVHWEIAVDIGEAVYTGDDLVGRENDCTGIAISLWSDDGNLLFKTVSAVEHPMAEVLDIEALTNEAWFGEAPAYRLTGADIHKVLTPAVPYYGNVHYRIELVDLTSDVNEASPDPSHYDWTGTHIICQIPGLESFPRMLREILASYIRHDAGPYPPTIIAEQFVTGSGGSAGHYSWEGATIAHTYANYLHVTAWVEDYLGNVLTDVTEIRAATPYVSGTDIYPFLNVHLWKSGGIDMALPVPAYDIVCVVKFDGN